MLKQIVLNNKRFHEKEFTTEKLISVVNEKFDLNAKNLPRTWLSLLYQFVFEDEKIYWDKNSIELAYHRIKEIHLIAEQKQQFQELRKEVKWNMNEIKE
ncbi:hypothetical protein AMS60_16185 [Bacillus sp. FJAT-21945]|nr:hypothetical protein AMS60_16185 [Bacillus sp. FJAT-21945]